MTVRHFFPRFGQWLGQVADPRRQDRITYPLEYLIWEILLTLMSGGGSCRQWVEETATDGFLQTLMALSEIEGRVAAHPATCFYLLGRLDPAELIGFTAMLVKRLLRMRCLEKFRFVKEWLVAVDATWMRVYDHQHCDHCLRQTHKDGSTTWFHAVLEAKLLLPNGMTISLGSVSIENPSGDYDKQDCESKAFFRLAALLHKLYPRLPMCIIGDSLYGCGPVIEECQRRGWSHILVFKPGRLPTLWADAERKWARGKTLSHQRANGARQQFSWATGLKYGDCTVHAIHCSETSADGKQSTWAWITDHRPSKDTVEVIANQGGRPRSQIEQAFNEQKNGQFQLRHDYGSQERAWYNLYLLVQIAHLLTQLMCFSDLVKRLSSDAKETFRDAFNTLRNFFRLMAQSIQHDLPDPRWCSCHAPDIQVRFPSG